MSNLLEQAINCDDGDRAAKIIRDALGALLMQHSLVQQKFRYAGKIALILIFTVGLCWGLAHI